MWTVCWVEEEKNVQTDHWVQIEDPEDLVHFLKQMKGDFGDISHVVVFPPDSAISAGKIVID